MATLVPACEVTPERVRELRNSCAVRAQEIVMAAGHVGPALIYRDLLPTDLGPRLGEIRNQQICLEGAWLEVINWVVPHYQAIGVYGYGVLTPDGPLACQMRVDVGPVTIAQNDLIVLRTVPQGPPDPAIENEGRRWMRARVGYFSDPLYFPPDQLVRISFLYDRPVAAQQDAFMLMGYVAEPEGWVVARPVAWRYEIPRQGPVPRPPQPGPAPVWSRRGFEEAVRALRGRLRH